MKKAILLKFSIALLSFFITIPVTAQKITTDVTPKRADLAISGVQLIEATRNPATGLHKVKVSVTIRNNGDALSPATSLKMMIQNHLLNLVAPPNPQPKNPLYELGENQPVNSIAPGQPLTTEYLFTETKKVITTKSFGLALMADAGNALKEINETDNWSAQINATPEDRTEYVAVVPGIPLPQLPKTDTFEYTIGRADFHLQPIARTSADLNAFFQCFIETNPHGITIKKFGGDAIIRNVTLIAPLHLPVGSKIRRIKFNYIKLAGTDLVPHLVLRSHHQQTASNEGWGLNTPITSYWVTSPGLDGTEGYRVMSSITNSGFNMPIGKGSTYYFEILGADARSTATPMSSEWPTNDKIFIWSINVYYTLE
jgi:CARDB